MTECHVDENVIKIILVMFLYQQFGTEDFTVLLCGWNPACFQATTTSALLLKSLKNSHHHHHIKLLIKLVVL